MTGLWNGGYEIGTDCLVSRGDHDELALCALSRAYSGLHNRYNSILV